MFHLVVNHVFQTSTEENNSVVRCLTGHATGGGGHLGGTVFATGGGHEKFFRKVDSFWRFGKSGGKRQKLSPFRKIFSCPPPRCEHSNTQMSPPPVACPVRHIFGKFLNFLTFFGRFGLFYMLVGKKHCCSSGCHFVISPGEPHQ